jgi:hypothetical protein
MVDIKGEFEVSLSNAIDVAPDFSEPGLPLCQFQIQRDKITIWPLKISEPRFESEEYEPPQLTEIKAIIIREIDFGKAETKILPRREEKAFERILIESTRRFVTLVKHKINQWDLDTRHPIYAYSYCYWCGGARLETEFPIAEGSKRMPEYTQGTIVFATRDLQRELSRIIWQAVVDEIPTPITVPLYEELITDAKTFRSQMSYDSAVLYSAIASELMLEKICQHILKIKHSLSDTQCETIMSKLRIPGILDLIQQLDPTLSIAYSDLNSVFRLRNKIAHGETQNVEWQEASDAIKTCEHLSTILSTMLPAH